MHNNLSVAGGGSSSAVEALVWDRQRDEKRHVFSRAFLVFHSPMLPQRKGLCFPDPEPPEKSSKTGFTTEENQMTSKLIRGSGLFRGAPGQGAHSIQSPPPFSFTVAKMAPVEMALRSQRAPLGCGMNGNLGQKM